MTLPHTSEARCCKKCECNMERTSDRTCHNLTCLCHAPVSQEKLPSPSQEGWTWEKDFEALYVKKDGNLAENTDASYLKAFIRGLLSQARASTLKEVGEEMVGLEKTVFLPLPEDAERFMGDFERGTVGGANYAIRTVIELLQEKGDSKGDV